jgi:hypothetical protein
LLEKGYLDMAIFAGKDAKEAVAVKVALSFRNGFFIGPATMT